MAEAVRTAFCVSTERELIHCNFEEIFKNLRRYKTGMEQFFNQNPTRCGKKHSKVRSLDKTSKVLSNSSFFPIRQTFEYLPRISEH